MAPVLMGNCISVLLCLPQLVTMPALAMKDWAPILYLGIFQVGLAYWCLTQAMVKLSALEASLLILIEPALNPLWTWIMHGEKPAMTAMGGGAMIIGSALLKSWHDRKNVVI
jgi:drug/metabolite transporter, DME family